MEFDEDPLVLETLDVIQGDDAIGGPSTSQRKGGTRKKKKEDTNSHLCEGWSLEKMLINLFIYIYIINI